MRRVIFEEDGSEQIWLEGKPLYADANILITVGSATGERSAYISGSMVTEVNSSQLVDPAPQAVPDDSPRNFAGVKNAVTISGYTLAILLLAFSALSFSGNVKARIVLTGSMAPAISAGDVIITVPVDKKAPKLDDVIAYQAKRFNGDNVAVFSHRIIGGDIENGFIVKGDANKSPDPQKPKATDILGVVLFTIPFIGNLLTPKALFLLIPCFFGIWLIMDAMKNVE